MNREDMLARLVAQGTEDGGDLVTLRAIVEEASELGAERALARMGLDDEAAVADMRELRQLLQAWRDAKASAWKAAVAWVVRGCLALLLIGIAYAMRNLGEGPLPPDPGALGFTATSGGIVPGDVLLLRAGPGQLHLAIAATGEHFVHAHAGLGKVVVQPGPPPGEVLQHWRPKPLKE